MKLIPTQTIVVQRDGQQVVPTIGEPFDFTDAEVSDIQKLAPSAVREPVNELEKTAAAPKAAGGKKAKEADL